MESKTIQTFINIDSPILSSLQDKVKIFHWLIFKKPKKLSYYILHSLSPSSSSMVNISKIHNQINFFSILFYFSIKKSKNTKLKRIRYKMFIINFLWSFCKSIRWFFKYLHVGVSRFIYHFIFYLTRNLRWFLLGAFLDELRRELWISWNLTANR